MICILLIICVISGAISAPAEVNPLYSLVINDNRTVNLRKHPFVAECKGSEEFSMSLCYAMFDAALSFNNQKMEFTTTNATYDRFCETLNQVLPQKPVNNDSFNAFKDSARWFKDVINSKDGEVACNENCFYTDRFTYEQKLTPVCEFILNQYSFLANLTSAPATALVSSETQKSDETKSNEAVTFSVSPIVQVVPAVELLQKSVISSEAPAPKTSVETLTRQEPSPVVVVDIKSSEEKTKVTNSSAAQAKPIVQTTATTIKKTETTKTEVDVKADEPVKIDDIENGEENVFDNEAEGDPLETPDKDQTDPKGEYHDDDEDEYGEDSMARNNNNKPQTEVKLPLESEPTLAFEAPHKKIEIVNFQEDPDSNFFTYLCGLMFLCVLLYILHQNRQKLLALCLEGRRGNRRARERSRGGSKAAYSKLDCNLEEAITSKKSLSGKSMDIIY